MKFCRQLSLSITLVLMLSWEYYHLRGSCSDVVQRFVLTLLFCFCDILRVGLIPGSPDKVWPITFQFQSDIFTLEHITNFTSFNNVEIKICKTNHIEL